jgi:hypothetical protein
MGDIMVGTAFTNHPQIMIECEVVMEQAWKFRITSTVMKEISVLPHKKGGRTDTTDVTVILRDPMKRLATFQSLPKIKLRAFQGTFNRC